MVELVDGKPINRMNDRYLKFLFGSEKRKEITIKFFNAVFEDKLPLKISDIKFINRDIDQENLEEKWGSVDVICETNNGETIITEFQGYTYTAMIERILDYWSQKYQILGIKEDYNLLKPVYCISVLTFNLLKSKKRHHNLYLIKNYDDNDILTRVMRLHFIELPKWNKDKIHSDQLTNLDIFIAYLSSDVTNEELLALSKRYQLMAQLLSQEDVFFADKENRDAYLLIERRKKDEMSHENYIKTEAKKEGIKEGVNQTKREMVQVLKRKKIDIDVIKEATGWTEEQILACPVQ